MKNQTNFDVFFSMKIENIVRKIFKCYSHLVVANVVSCDNWRGKNNSNWY